MTSRILSMNQREINEGFDSSRPKIFTPHDKDHAKKANDSEDSH